jgi:D-amino peptidase
MQLAPLLLVIGVPALLAQVPPIKPKVLLYYDMEGITGINRVEQTMARKLEHYKPARDLLTDDVNAAIRGLVAGGAGEIVVTDGHGSGNRQEPDILLDRLDPRARMEFRDREFDPYIDVPDGTYKAIVCIGMHARGGTNGFLAHSFTMEPVFRVNGQEINETEMIAHSAGSACPLCWFRVTTYWDVKSRNVFRAPNTW